jgi:formamidopyrimidine-DNA glycosylase
MPEAAEVTLMMQELKHEFDNCVLMQIHIHGGRHKKRGPPKHLKQLQLALPLKIRHITNKGKLGIFELDKGWSFTIVHGMTGHWWIPETSKGFRTMEGYQYSPKYNHIEFVTTCGHFFFNDPRTFGFMTVYNPKDKTDTLGKKLKDLGPDLLKDLPRMKQTQFNELFARYRPNKVIADVLLDQRFVSGVGNYIRAEALYRAKIHPLTQLKNLTADDKKRLKKELIRVGEESYKCQKSKGLHKFKFKIYRQKHARCIRRQNRSIWYDPKVQPRK